MSRMWDDGRLRRIYDKTQGYCSYCQQKLAWKNYGKPGSRGAWEVDHSKPKSMGGSDHLNNLVPACVRCNRAKGNLTTAQFRNS